MRLILFCLDKGSLQSCLCSREAGHQFVFTGISCEVFYSPFHYFCFDILSLGLTFSLVSQLLFWLFPHRITLWASSAAPGMSQGCQCVGLRWECLNFPVSPNCPHEEKPGRRALFLCFHMHGHCWKVTKCPSPQLQQTLMVWTRLLRLFPAFAIDSTKLGVLYLAVLSKE